MRLIGDGRRLSAALCAVFACVAVAGCGSSGGQQGPPTVHLSLTAPVDGARVNVGNVLVLGTVDPPVATVRVAGRSTHVANGSFRRWVSLRRGLTRIGVVAKAPGYISATLNVAVHSGPRRYAIPHSPDNVLSDFLGRANQACSDAVTKFDAIGLAHLDQVVTQNEAVQISSQILAIGNRLIPRLRAIHAPAKQAPGYAAFIDHLQTLIGQVTNVVNAAAAGNASNALAIFGGAKETLALASAEGTTLELFTCANNLQG
jgi:hypothetical protein